MTTAIAPIDASWIGRHPLPEQIRPDFRVRIGVVGGLDYPEDAAGLASAATEGCEVFAVDRADPFPAILADPAQDLWIVMDAAGIDAGLYDAIRAHEARAVLIADAADIERLTGSVVEVDPGAAAEHAAISLGALVVQRAEGSMIAHPDGRLLRHDGPPAARVDVLAGLIASFIRRGASPIRAPAWGVWIEAEARRSEHIRTEVPAAMPRRA